MRDSLDCAFVVEDCVAGSNGDSPKGGDGDTVEFLNTKENVGFVHGLEVEVGSDDTVAVDDGASHVRADFRSIGSLDDSGANRCSWKAVQPSDEKVDEIRRRNTGELSDVNIRDTYDVAPVSEDR